MSSKSHNSSSGILSAIVLVGTIIFIVGGFGIYESRQLDDLADKIHNHPLAVSNTARQIQANINAMHRSMKDVVIASTPEEIKNAIEQVDAAEMESFKAFELILERFLGDRRYVESAYQDFKNWKRIRDTVIDLKKQGRMPEAAEITKTKGPQHINLIHDGYDGESGLNYILQFADNKADEFRELSDRRKKKATIEILFIFALSFVLALIAAILFRRSLRFNTELEKSETRFRIIFEQAAVGVSIIESKTGQFIRANNKFSGIFGYDKHEMTATTFNKITHQDDRQSDLNNMEKLIKGEIREFSMEKRYIHKNGSIVWGNLFVSPMWDAGQEPNYHIAIVEDITKRKQAEESLEKRIVALTRPLDDAESIAFEELFNLADIQRLQDEFAEATGVASIITHTDGTPITNPSNFCRLCADIIRKSDKGLANCFKSDAAVGKLNPAGPNVQLCLSGGLWDAGAGITVGGQHIANWLIGQVRDKTQGEADMSKYAQEIGVDVQSFNEAFREVPAMTKGQFDKIAQMLFTLATQLSNIAYQNIQQARFITDRKKAGESLHRSEEQFRGLVETSSDCIWEVNANAIYTYISPQVETILGYKPVEIIGRTPFDLMPSEEAERIEVVFNNYLETGKPIVNLENILLHKDGRHLLLETNAVAFHDDSGKVIGYRGMGRDITGRKQLEENLRQSQKMESVGTLAGGVAHEFNNILGGITGYTELAIDDAPQNGPVRESLDEILSLSNRARDVVKQILAFSRKGTKEHKPLQAHLIIEESLKVLRATIPSTIEIKPRIDENSGTILADPTQLNQICTNLCMNAAHAMEDNGGVLEIGLTSVILDSEDVKQYSDLKTGEYVKLTVSDSGSGINPENLAKIFDPFYTTKGVGKGTGMGLSVVHGIIKDHNGAIAVSSKLGEGTTFTVFLPRVEARIDKIENDDAIPTGAESILVVDDEEQLVFLLKTILGRLGYNVTAMTSSLETLELFKKDPLRYDLIITDLTMPNLTGDRLASEIIAIRPNMPVIIATGYTHAVDSEKVKQSGIKAFIPKPYQKQDLAKTIRLILDE